MVLSVYHSLLNDGTIKEKCGTPGKNCENICVDLDLNVMDCPEDHVLRGSSEYIGEAMDHADL